ncbi:hypothetical protein AA313_de0204240 [Arthrobotrys entomopaga]|nr:hypothetical protein AA313_de0204240 [Arthrobotrys entomopaga]
MGTRQGPIPLLQTSLASQLLWFTRTVLLCVTSAGLERDLYTNTSQPLSSLSLPFPSLPFLWDMLARLSCLRTTATLATREGKKKKKQAQATWVFRCINTSTKICNISLSVPFIYHEENFRSSISSIENNQKYSILQCLQLNLAKRWLIFKPCSRRTVYV